MPQPKTSSHLSPSTITIFPYTMLYPMSTSADSSVKGK